MTAYLGFDRSLVEALAAAIGRATDELDGLRCDDPAADEAMRSIGAARRGLDTWQPIVRSLASCGALDGYVPQHIAAGDLVNAWLRSVAGERGWQTVTDPARGFIGPPTPMTVAGARALGEALSSDAGADAFDDAEVTWLRDRLTEVASRPELVAALLPALTTVGWASVCGRLAAVRIERVSSAVMSGGSIDGGEADGWATIDEVFTRLGGVIAADRVAHPRADATTLLPGMSPMAAALLVRHLDLPADRLSAVTREIVDRERIELRAADHTLLGPRAADLLFTTVLATPGAAAAYVAATVDDPGLVLDVAFDAQLGNAVAIAGTSDDGRTVPPLLRWVLDAARSSSSAVYDPALVTTAATVMAPHLVGLFRADAHGLGLSAAERQAVCELILDDHTGALDRLLEARRPATEAAQGVLGDARAGSTELVEVVRDIAATIAILDSLSRARALRSAQHDLDEWDRVWSLVEKAAGITSKIDAPVAAAVGPAVRAVHTAAGLLDWGPPRMAESRTGALRHLDNVTTVAAATLVASRFDALVAAGRIADDAAPPPVPRAPAEHDGPDVGTQYSSDFEDWVAGAGLDDDVANELRVVKQTVLSDHEATVSSLGALVGT